MFQKMNKKPIFLDVMDNNKRLGYMVLVVS
jgi:hypothetical protein